MATIDNRYYCLHATLNLLTIYVQILAPTWSWIPGASACACAEEPLALENSDASHPGATGETSDEILALRSENKKLTDQNMQLEG